MVIPCIFVSLINSKTTKMNNLIPTVGHPVVLVSHGVTVTIQAAHAPNEYSITAAPYGNRRTGWSREEVAAKIEELLSKGFEVQK